MANRAEPMPNAPQSLGDPPPRGPRARADHELHIVEIVLRASMLPDTGRPAQLSAVQRRVVVEHADDLVCRRRPRPRPSTSRASPLAASRTSGWLIARSAAAPDRSTVDDPGLFGLGHLMEQRQDQRVVGEVLGHR